MQQNGIFFVRIKDDLKTAFEDFFPHMSSNYLPMAKLFKTGKQYPVLAIDKVSVFSKDGKEVESARFLVPTENGNFLWIQCELFTYCGVEAPEGSAKR